MTKHRIEIDDTKGLDDIALQFTLMASYVFNERSPDQWEAGMAKLTGCIARMVREGREPDQNLIELLNLKKIEDGEDS